MFSISKELLIRGKGLKLLFFRITSMKMWIGTKTKIEICHLEFLERARSQLWCMRENSIALFEWLANWENGFVMDYDYICLAG